MSSNYQGKVIVITGASSGFGRGTALKLAKKGCHVVLAARSADTVEALATECQASGGQALAVPTSDSSIGEFDSHRYRDA